MQLITMMMMQQHVFPRPSLDWTGREYFYTVVLKQTAFIHLQCKLGPLLVELSGARSCCPPLVLLSLLRSNATRSSMMLSGHTGAGGGGRRLFTASQWQELEHQALIFKYMATGAPVPHDLVVPLRLATGVDTVPSLAFPPQPPALGMGYWGCYGAAGPKVLGMKKPAAEDPEPGRCRRTDGKKWRCSAEAYGASKYCEKHMNRKTRSRKPVEATSSTPAAAQQAYRAPALSISQPAPDAPSYQQHLHHGGASPLQQLHLDAGGYHASPPPSYRRYAYAGESAFPGGYGYGPSSRELQEAEMRRQRCHDLGADLSLDKPPPTTATEKPLRLFFDEWDGGVDDATQLSISMPTAKASPSDLAAVASARYHDGA